MCRLFTLLVRSHCAKKEILSRVIVSPAFHKNYRQAEITINLPASTAHGADSQEFKYFMYNRAVDLQNSSKSFQALPLSTYSDRFYEADRRWAFVHEKLEICSNTHGSHCRRELWAPLPARILDLADLDRGIVRLTVTEGQCDRYACLSHCWGGSRIVAKLSGENIETYQTEGIRAAALPKTFQDAMDICKKLNLRYLWIDSLCIRQDSVLDWQEESPKMAAYYGNCFCCIAAVSSHSSNAGWQLHERANATKMAGTGPDGLPFRLLACPVKDIESFDHLHHFTQISEEALAEEFPLIKRAWAFQERRLAPRVLHLCAHEIVLECASDLVCECGHCKDNQFNWSKAITEPDIWKYSISDTAPQPKAHHGQSPVQDWRLACTIYSTLSMTFANDKLTAISGLAKSIGFSGQYLAGLWETDLLANMCWYIGPDLAPATPIITTQTMMRENERRLAERNRQTQYIAPSWSWASVEEPINYRLISRHPRPRPYATLQYANIELESQDPMGRVAPDSHLVLKGRTIESKWTCNLEGKTEDQYYKLSDVKGSQGNFTLYGLEGEYVCIWFHGKDPWEWTPEQLSFLPDHNLASSGVSADEPLHLMPLLSEKTLIGVDRLKGNLYGQSPIRGYDGNQNVYSDYPKVCALILRRLHDHQLEKVTSNPVFERVGFTLCVVHEAVANAWLEVEGRNLLLV